MTEKRHRWIFISLIITFLSLIGVNKAWSHSIVVKEIPVPNSQHETSPKEVNITFGSEVEKNFISIKIFNEMQQEVTNTSAQISNNQQEIHLDLPELTSGIYKVQYYAVSSNDGHPIRGSYHFKVLDIVSSQQPDDEGNTSDPPLFKQANDETNKSEVISFQQTDSIFNKVNAMEVIIFIMRAIYYIGLLLMIGWVFWWRYIQYYSTELKTKYLFWGFIIQMLHLVGLTSIILIQLNIFRSNGLSFPSDFPFKAHFGLMWFASFFLSLISFVCLFRNKWLDFFWLLVIVASKSLNGHSLEFEPTILLVISNCIHLFSASIWAAGLLFTIVFWRKQRLYVQSFLPLFSRYAFWSIVILSITGVFTAISLLPNFNLLLTNWGLFLVFKLLVVILVVMTGGIIRLKLLKYKTADLGIWLKLDFTLMMTIIILVSILTYLNPLP